MKIKQYPPSELSAFGTSELIELVQSLQYRVKDSYKPLCEICKGIKTCKYNSFCIDIPN